MIIPRANAQQHGAEMIEVFDAITGEKVPGCVWADAVKGEIATLGPGGAPVLVRRKIFLKFHPDTTPHLKQMWLDYGWALPGEKEKRR